MICHNCNHDNLRGSSRCEQCGATLDETTYETSQFDAVEEDNAEEEIVERVSEITSSLKDSLSLTPEEVNAHVSQLRKNLRLGKGDLRNRLLRFNESLKGRGADIFRNPDRVTIKNIVISFIAWAILKFSTPFHRRIVKFLISPLGLLALLVIAVVYSLFEREIIFKIKEMKGVVTDDAVSQQRDQGTEG